MRALKAKYSDLPMSLADVSLVLVAEQLNLRKVFTLDRHFRIYRPRDVRTFEVFPSKERLMPPGSRRRLRRQIRRPHLLL